jgi:pheromone shutdown protein TraB
VILVVERDLHFISIAKDEKKLQNCKKIVIIVGMGHMHGILNYWNEEIDVGLLYEVVE